MRLLRGFVYLQALCSMVYAANADSATFFPSHPSIEYRPINDCLQYTHRGCYKWGYAWQSETYRNSQTGLSQSVAFTTDEHNVEVGKELRQVSLVIPRARQLLLYGPPRGWRPDYSKASLELCIDQWERPCIQLDIQDTYSRATNVHEPVLIWSGPLPEVARHKTLTVTLRMTETAPSERPKLMALDSIICYGLYEPLVQRPYYSSPPIGSTLRNILVDDLDKSITFRPRDRWDTSAKAGDDGMFWTVTQASTLYDVKQGTPNPELSFGFRGNSITVWSAPPSRVEHPPGAVRICLDGVCEVVDVFQIYLNPLLALPSELMQLSRNTSADANGDVERFDDVDTRSVPIWSASNLDYTRDHQVSVTLIEGNPRFEETGVDRLRVLALDYVTYTEVLGADPSFRNNAASLSDGMVAFISISGVLALVFVYALMKRMEGKTKLSVEYAPIDLQHLPGAYSWASADSSCPATSSTAPPAYTPGYRG